MIITCQNHFEWNRALSMTLGGKGRNLFNQTECQIFEYLIIRQLVYEYFSDENFNA